MSKLQVKLTPRHDGHVKAFAVAFVMARSFEEGECRLWSLSVNGGGAPNAKIAGRNGVNVRRWLWERTRGQIGEGNRIVAKCGNSRCLSCLAEMTASEVGQWMSGRGLLSTPSARAAHTKAARARSPYTAEQVNKAKALRRSGLSLKEVEAQTGVPWMRVSKYARGVPWMRVSKYARGETWGGLPQSSVFTMAALGGIAA